MAMAIAIAIGKVIVIVITIAKVSNSSSSYSIDRSFSSSLVAIEHVDIKGYGVFRCVSVCF